MRRSLRHLSLWLATLVVGFPLAILTTLALFPFWSWLEARFGIEAVGHSGPADWCYWVAYAAWAVLIGGGLMWRRRKGAAGRAVHPARGGR